MYVVKMSVSDIYIDLKSFKTDDPVRVHRLPLSLGNCSAQSQLFEELLPMAELLVNTVKKWRKYINDKDKLNKAAWGGVGVRRKRQRERDAQGEREAEVGGGK